MTRTRGAVGSSPMMPGAALFIEGVDGKRFHYREAEEGKKEGPKSRNWKGSEANWPIGIANADGSTDVSWKRVRIFGHADEAGQMAIKRWAEQLQSVQADVDGFDFSGLIKTDGTPVKDLNEFVQADHKRSDCPIEMVTGSFDFALERKG
jgi:hypothetical protein